MPLTEIPTETPTEPPQPVRIVAGRYGEIDTHELIRLLDTIEDERARGRFRESLYISIFVWIAIAWFFLYGQRLLWHPPKLQNVATVHEHELASIQLPTAHLPTPAIKPTPPPPHPTIDNSTMERLRAMSRQPATMPNAPQPQPIPTPPPPPPVVNTPQPRTPPPVVADAPTAQPLRPNFGKPSSAGDAVRNALNDAAHNRGGARDLGGVSPPRLAAPLDLGGSQILSDTQGVDFTAYMRRFNSDIYRNWEPLIPQEVLPPLYKRGKAVIILTILPDGSIGGMKLEDSTHDEAINRSCWGSITAEGQFPPLPSAFHGPNLQIRLYYTVGTYPE